MEESPSRIHTAPSSAIGTPTKGYEPMVNALANDEPNSGTPARDPDASRHSLAADMTPSSAKRILRQMMFGLDVSKDLDYDDGAVGSSNPSSPSSTSDCTHGVASTAVADSVAGGKQMGELAPASHHEVLTNQDDRRPFYGCDSRHSKHHSKPPVDDQYAEYFEDEIASPFKRPYAVSRSRNGDSFSHPADVSIDKQATDITNDTNDDVIGWDDFTSRKLEGNLPEGLEGHSASKLTRRITGPNEGMYPAEFNMGAGYDSIDFVDREAKKREREQRRVQRLLKHQSRSSSSLTTSATSAVVVPLDQRRSTTGPYIQSEPRGSHQESSVRHRSAPDGVRSSTTPSSVISPVLLRGGKTTSSTTLAVPAEGDSPSRAFSTSQAHHSGKGTPIPVRHKWAESIVFSSPSSISARLEASPPASALAEEPGDSWGDAGVVGRSSSQRVGLVPDSRSFAEAPPRNASSVERVNYNVASTALDRFASRSRSEGEGGGRYPHTASPMRYRYLSGAPPPPRRADNDARNTAPLISAAAAAPTTSNRSDRPLKHPNPPLPSRQLYTSHIYASPLRMATLRERAASEGADNLSQVSDDNKSAAEVGHIKYQSQVKRAHSSFHTTSSTRDENKYILETLFYRAIKRRSRQHTQQIHPLQRASSSDLAPRDPQEIKVPLAFNYHAECESRSDSPVNRTYDPTYAAIIEKQNRSVQLGFEANSTVFMTSKHSSIVDSAKTVTQLRDSSGHSTFFAKSGSNSVTLGVSETAARERRVKLLRETSSLIAMCARDKPHNEAVRVARKFNAVEETNDQVDRVRREHRAIRPPRAVPSPLSVNISSLMKSPPRERLAGLQAENRRLLEDGDSFQGNGVPPVNLEQEKKTAPPTPNNGVIGDL